MHTLLRSFVPPCFAIAVAASYAVLACSHQTPPPKAAPAAPAPSPHDGIVEGLVGTWAGQADTPIGEIPMALEFVRNPDGSIHARVEQSRDMYLDFRFHQDGGRWLLTEEGAFPQLGVQRHTLSPAGTDDGAARWSTDEPSYLVVAIGLDGDAMSFVTHVRGEAHASFQLRRVAAVSSR